MNQLGTLTTAATQERIASIIERSFDTRPMPSGDVTQREVDRRVDIAKSTFVVLLNECGWSEQRILDHLPAFLARALDGEEAIPEWAQRRVGDDETAGWGAEAAGRVESERRLSALAATRDEQPLIIVPGRTRHGK